MDIVKKLPKDIQIMIYEKYLKEQHLINNSKLIQSIKNDIIICFECNRFIMCVCDKCMFSSKFVRPLWTRWFVCDECEENGVMDFYEFIENEDQEEMFIYDPNYSSDDE